MFYVVFEMKFKLNPNEKRAFHNIRITKNAASTIANSFRYPQLVTDSERHA